MFDSDQCIISLMILTDMLDKMNSVSTSAESFCEGFIKGVSFLIRWHMELFTITSIRTISGVFWTAQIPNSYFGPVLLSCYPHL